MGIDLYPNMIHAGDLSPDAFGAQVDEICKEIHDATKGFGTNETKLLKVMGSQSPETRCKVPQRYKDIYGKELQQVMKAECGNRDFGTALQFLAVSPVEAECDMIDMACKGLGTNELLLFTILCGRSNKEMEILKKTYFQLNTKDLGRVLDSELGGALEQLVFNVLQAAEEQYDPNFHTEDKAKKDAETLYKMGQGGWGTNESGMFKILCASPSEHLKRVNAIYADKYGYTLSKALEKELSGHVRDAACFMLGMKIKPYETAAGLIDKATKGFGTNELLLTATVIRYQAVMKDVNAAHIELYGQGIADRIRGEIRGDYRSLLLELLASEV